jgi:phenylacetate-coenzyme A ligase PaaK-like adenylate-forming protein
MQRTELLEKIEQVNTSCFDETSMELFRYQVQNNELYGSFIHLLGFNPKDITIPQQIPFLPISFFKTKVIKTGNWSEEIIFKSSGTTGTIQSSHYVRTANDYLKNCLKGFTKFYGSPREYAILALLPSYLEREGSSLILMAEYFIKLSKYSESGFFLNNMDELADRLKDCMDKNIPVLLLGVSFALLDFAERYPMHLRNTFIMETGGMKGRRKELLREEMHAILKHAFNQSSIHSEYGMTELMSQAYSKGNGIFSCSESMKILIRDSSDPLTILPAGRNGAINIIDLANIDSCAFIATDDIGKLHENGDFEILGRFDSSDIRGCNLLVS